MLPLSCSSSFLVHFQCLSDAIVLLFCASLLFFCLLLCFRMLFTAFHPFFLCLPSPQPQSQSQRFQTKDSKQKIPYRRCKTQDPKNNDPNPKMLDHRNQTNRTPRFVQGKGEWAWAFFRDGTEVTMKWIRMRQHNGSQLDHLSCRGNMYLSIRVWRPAEHKFHDRFRAFLDLCSMPVPATCPVSFFCLWQGPVTIIVSSRH